MEHDAACAGQADTLRYDVASRVLSEGNVINQETLDDLYCMTLSGMNPQHITL
jgi:hypothetical protein